jgi:ParB/RepB/Spo0J family partition protein
MTTAEFRFVPVAQLHESPFNPRRLFDAARLQELTDSVRAHGVRTPLLVRPNAKGYEIAAGHRRYRAAKAAGLAEVPAVVQAMEDVEFIELLSFDNLQRQDMTALEEAEGYRLLMTKASYTVERIAERVGMSVKYVYDRVRLLELTEPARKALREDKITPGHAILLARLKPKEQELAMHADQGGLWQHEYALEDPDGKGPMRDPLKAKSVRELDAWIAEHIRFDARTPDPMLFPETVATLSKAAAQAEKVVKITHDLFVQDTARDPKERTITPRSWKRADGKRGSTSCEYAVTGVIVVGAGRGEAYKVCINKDKCAIHWGAEKRERAKRASRGEVGGGRASADTSWQRAEAKRKSEQAVREAESARWEKARPQLLEALAAAVKKASARANGLLASIVLEACDLDWAAKKIDVAHYVPRGTTAEDALRHMAFRLLVNDLTDGNDYFPKRAKAFGLDVRKIVDEAAPKPKAEKVQTSAART